MNSIFMQPTSTEDLEKVIRYNIGKASQIRKEIEQLENTQSQIPETKKTNIIKTEDSFEEEIEDEQEEYLYYYSNLLDELKTVELKMPSEELKELVIDNLPSAENKNYTNIVNRIKLEFIKEMHDLEVLKQEETDRDFIEEIELEQTSLKNVLDIINYAQTTGIEDSIEIASKKENQLVFLKTHNGSIYAENDLYSIKEEYYDSFKELLLSIQNGTFKRVKKFNKSNLVLGGISEVRGFKTRIIFDRVGKDKYVIINIFVKKSDCDKGYLDLIKNRVDFYKKNKAVILECLNDSNYLEENKQITSNLFKCLDEKNLVKTMKLGGVKDGK